jgi:hypothetical protein
MIHEVPNMTLSKIPPASKVATAIASAIASVVCQNRTNIITATSTIVTGQTSFIRDTLTAPRPAEWRESSEIGMTSPFGVSRCGESPQDGDVVVAGYLDTTPKNSNIQKNSLSRPGVTPATFQKAHRRCKATEFPEGTKDALIFCDTATVEFSSVLNSQRITIVRSDPCPRGRQISITVCSGDRAGACTHRDRFLESSSRSRW